MEVALPGVRPEAKRRNDTRVARKRSIRKPPEIKVLGVAFNLNKSKMLLSTLIALRCAQDLALMLTGARTYLPL